MSTPLPTGTVTFLFTDIEGSAPLAQQYPAELPARLAEHHALMRQAVETQRGWVFRIVGDAVCAAFHTAPEALAAAVAAQRGLHAADSHPVALRVRMGLHSGPAQASGGDGLGGGYEGYLTLTRAQRVMAAAHGGQILLSGASAELLQGHLPGDVTLRPMGAHRLKGLEGAEQLCQVVARGLPSEFPPLQSINVRPNNLPLALTPFFGRQATLAEIRQRLAQTRLMTLSGPGGTGKTRLALEMAAEALAGTDFPDGAWLVELAAVANPALVVPTLASVLNVFEQPGRALASALADFLRAKRLLLILDNCEHLIDACAGAAQALLQAGPGTKVLATSREPLGLSGETIVRVPSLALPGPDDPFAVLAENEAVQVFVARAQAVKPGLTLTPQNAAAITQICRRLDGIPLALELAAARVALFTPARIADRLDDRFRLLTGSNRSALPRQQTLEALIDWSYDLLAPEEQALFRALAVCVGGFTYEAAEAVLGGDVLETLAQLVNKSLVLAEEDPTEGETRYRLLETIRQYAGNKLLAAGEVEAVRDRHLAYFVRFSVEADAQRGADNQRHWAGRLVDERDNLRAAIEWALERDPAQAIGLIGRQEFFWGQRGFAAEALRWSDEALARVTAQPSVEGAAKIPPAVLALAYRNQAVLAEMVGEVPRAHAALEKSLSYWRESGDLRGLSLALGLWGAWGVYFGVPNPYRAAAEEALAIARRIQYKTGIGLALSALGIEKMLLGEYAAAQADFEASVAVLRQDGDARAANMGLMSLGQLALLQGDYSTARARYAESLVIFEDFRSHYYACIARSGLAEALRRAGDFAQAVPVLRRTLADWQALGNLGAVARCLECLAFVGVELAGAVTKAPTHDNRLAWAARLLGAAEALRETRDAPMPPDERAEYDTYLNQLRASGPPEALAAHWREGRALSVDEARTEAEALELA